MVNEFDCVQTTIINDSIICGVHTYSKGDLDALIVKCGWTPIYNGVMNDNGDILTIIQKCEN